MTLTRSDLIDSETDGLQVQPFLAQFASVLLHEGHDDVALIIFARFLQLQLELRVGPEGV